MGRSVSEATATRFVPSAPAPFATKSTNSSGLDLFSWGVLALYVAIVALAASRHEMWRDEVRAWSVAVTPPSLPAMVEAVRAEGHPLLWYLLLRFAHLVFHAPWVLPLVSGAVAVAAAWCWLRFSPLPRAWRVLFLFGTFALYHYSVMCRNYGIGMLLMWVLAAGYQRRFERPWLHGLMLGLLANTSAHAAILAGGFTLAWGADLLSLRASRARASLGVGIALSGLALSAAIAFPRADTSVTAIRTTPAVSLVAAAINTVLAFGLPLRRLVTASVPLTWIGFRDPDGGMLTSLLSATLLVMVAIRLRTQRDLLLAFVSSTLVLGWFFFAVYPSSLRHVGLLFVMILALEWIARRREGPTPVPRRARAALAWALSMVLGIHVVAAVADVSEDFVGQRSSAKAFASFLHARPELESAIVVGEPDYLVETLPYYTTHRLYSVEEGRFFRWVTFSHGVRDPLSLGDVLDAVGALARRERVPVLLAIGQRRVLADSSGEVRYRYGSHFTWSAEERRRLAHETRPLAEFEYAQGDENYVVFLADTTASASKQGLGARN